MNVTPCMRFSLMVPDRVGISKNGYCAADCSIWNALMNNVALVLSCKNISCGIRGSETHLFFKGQSENFHGGSRRSAINGKIFLLHFAGSGAK